MTRSAKPKRPHFVTQKGAYGIRRSDCEGATASRPSSPVAWARGSEAAACAGRSRRSCERLVLRHATTRRGLRLRVAADEREPPRLRPRGRPRAPQPAGGRRSGEAVPDSPVPSAGRALRSELGGRAVSDYHINVFYSDEDGGYVADIPDLEACSAFGASPEEALSEVAKAKEAWLAAAREAGKPIPAPRYRPAIYAR